MPSRCSCAGSSCSCSVVAGNGIVVTGVGSAANPFKVAVDTGQVRAGAPVVTGSRSSGAALTSLLAALATAGVIIDTTTT